MSLFTILIFTAQMFDKYHMLKNEIVDAGNDLFASLARSVRKKSDLSLFCTRWAWFVFPRSWSVPINHRLKIGYVTLHKSNRTSPGTTSQYKSGLALYTFRTMSQGLVKKSLEGGVYKLYFWVSLPCILGDAS